MLFPDGRKVEKYYSDRKRYSYLCVHGDYEEVEKVNLVPR